MIKFAIRHKGTGLLMPRAKKDAGYSHWRPGVPYVGHEHTNSYDLWQAKDGMGNAIPGSIRLLETEKQARSVITQWARGEMERDGDGGTMPAKGAAKRTADELEVVRMELVEVRT